MKVIFLDRDGVVNKEVGYLFKPSSFEFIDGVFEACRFFQSNNYQIIIITNQSGISRGYYSEDDYVKLKNWMLKKFLQNGINILDVYHCPHEPKSNCNCRKPKPGMFLKAKSLYSIDMESSWVIGDKEQDIEAANNAGISKTILVRSGHKIHEKNSNAKYILKSIHESIEFIK
jgi:D-glycero-D-manno-heptose 1,7-bisphosphate phosphatase